MTSKQPIAIGQWLVTHGTLACYDAGYETARALCEYLSDPATADATERQQLALAAFMGYEMRNGKQTASDRARFEAGVLDGLQSCAGGPSTIDN